MSVASDDDDDYISDKLSTDSSDNEQSHNDVGRPGLAPRPLSGNFFAPPFYGRPPTPLPPSPSLTSLLRPSRPTTPDASEDDNNHNHSGNGNNLSDPVPHTAPQVPTYEYYGFVLYLLSSLTFLFYLLWSYLPSPFLHVLGITYYPNRWWALAVPAFLVMTLCYIYVALGAYNTEVLTVPMSSVETIVDGAGRLAVVDGKGRIRRDGAGTTRAAAGVGAGMGRGGESRCDAAGRPRWREIWNEGTDGVMDIPLAGVCEVLYGEGRDVAASSGD